MGNSSRGDLRHEPGHEDHGFLRKISSRLMCCSGRWRRLRTCEPPPSSRNLSTPCQPAWVRESVNEVLREVCDSSPAPAIPVTFSKSPRSSDSVVLALFLACSCDVVHLAALVHRLDAVPENGQISFGVFACSSCRPCLELPWATISKTRQPGRDWGEHRGRMPTHRMPHPTPNDLPASFRRRPSRAP